MSVSDADLKRIGTLISPVGERLKVVRNGNAPRLVDGIYVVVNSTDKWAMSVYRNVKNGENDIEIAIDIHALVWPNFEEHGKADAWLKRQRSELEHTPSGVHAKQLENAFRIGLKLQGTWTFLERLRIQIMECSPAARWPLSTPARSRLIRGAAAHSASAQLPVPSLGELAIEHMLAMARRACDESGRELVTVAKTKEFRFLSDEAFREHVIQLVAVGRCALTGLQLDATMLDSDLAPSLDRIDSSGHYEPGNLQVVARFVNRWKSDDSDQNFRRLVALVRS